MKKKITDFLKTERSKEELKIALIVIREFKTFESMEEWMNIPFMTWFKLEQLEEFLDYLVFGKDLSDAAIEYMNDSSECVDETIKKFLKDEMGGHGFEDYEKQRKLMNERVKENEMK